MRLYIARRTHRTALYLPMQGTKDRPSLMFFLPQRQGKQISDGHLDELVRSQLEKQGVTKEADMQALVNRAEVEYEQRRKIEEAQAEVRRLMQIRALGGKLMQVGYRKWVQAFYAPTKRFKNNA